ncbi:rCG59203 [Rattus norvegicus]|uniref:RCG59203 n=1 Tax=Rattus norvegicus TaxID=10116 RepID=A6KIS5_RAT|nr:rCG59203 [Rattus norvegicus]
MDRSEGMTQEMAVRNQKVSCVLWDHRSDHLFLNLCAHCNLCSYLLICKSKLVY